MSDLISREAAIEAIYDLPNCNNGYSDTYDKSLIISVIEELPSAEPKKGKWVPFEYGDDTWHKCTACGVADNYISVVKRPNGTTGRLESVRNYCPNCGADMRGDDE